MRDIQMLHTLMGVHAKYNHTDIVGLDLEIIP